MQLTLKEYEELYRKSLIAFSKGQNRHWEQQIFQLSNDYDTVQGQLTFLFCYALSTWEHEDGAINYLTEQQVQTIISKIL